MDKIYDLQRQIRNAFENKQYALCCNIAEKIWNEPSSPRSPWDGW